MLAVVQFARALDFASTSGQYLINNATQGALIMNGIWYKKCAIFDKLFPNVCYRRYSLSNSTTDINAMDSLKDGDACRRDAALMAQLGINTIYIMAIDPELSHDDCFSIFNSVGIYVVVALHKDTIFMSTYDELARSYTSESLEQSFRVIDAVKDYDNLLGFDLGVLPLFGAVAEGSNMSYAEVEKIYRVRLVFTPKYMIINKGLLGYNQRHERVHR